MALPIFKSIEDCGDYSRAVEPFIPQLYDLPYQLWDAITKPEQLKLLYITTNPLVSAFAASLVLGAIFFVVSEINRNYSQVDRMWSILPNLYVVHLAVWARLAGLPHGRIDLVAAFTTIWSCRLTFNYWRRGGYNVGSEDYRWSIAKSYVPGFVWTIFNLTFISFIQSVLLFLFSCVPAYSILLTAQFESEVTRADLVYLLIEILLVVSEFISDGQQQKYQTAKHQYYKDAKVPKEFSQLEMDREQTIWFVLYQWSCYASNNLYGFAMTGSVCLVFLFQGSTWLTELITAGKYPEYTSYQKQVGMFIPTSFKGYTPPLGGPKVIRSSELAKTQQRKEKQK